MLSYILEFDDLALFGGYPSSLPLSMMSINLVKAVYDQQGYVVVPGLVDPEDDCALELKEACERVIARTRAALWPHRRTVGKQFPPYGDGNPESWGVQHIMHPDLGEPAFVQWYTSSKLLSVVTELLGCKETDLQMGV